MENAESWVIWWRVARRAVISVPCSSCAVLASGWQEGERLAGRGRGGERGGGAASAPSTARFGAVRAQGAEYESIVQG